MGGGRHPGAQGGDGWAGRTSGTPREGPLSDQAPMEDSLHPPPLPPQPSPRASLVGVACSAANPAGQGLTFDHVGHLQACQERKGIEGVVLLPEQKASMPPALHPRSQLEGTRTAAGPGEGMPLSAPSSGNQETGLPLFSWWMASSLLPQPRLAQLPKTLLLGDPSFLSPSLLPTVLATLFSFIHPVRDANPHSLKSSSNLLLQPQLPSPSFWDLRLQPPSTGDSPFPQLWHFPGPGSQVLTHAAPSSTAHLHRGLHFQGLAPVLAPWPPQPPPPHGAQLLFLSSRPASPTRPHALEDRHHEPLAQGAMW